jgi:hypothetical protein
MMLTHLDKTQWGASPPPPRLTVATATPLHDRSSWLRRPVERLKSRAAGSRSAGRDARLPAWVSDDDSLYTPENKLTVGKPAQPTTRIY